MAEDSFQQIAQKAGEKLKEQHKKIAQLLEACDPKKRSPLGAVESIMQGIDSSLWFDFLQLVPRTVDNVNGNLSGNGLNLIQFAKDKGHEDVFNYFETMVSESFYKHGFFHQYLYRAFKAIAEKKTSDLSAILDTVPIFFREQFLKTPWKDISELVKNSERHEESMAAMEGYVAPDDKFLLLNYANALQRKDINKIKGNSKLAKNPGKSENSYISGIQQCSTQLIETSYEPSVALLRKVITSPSQNIKISSVQEPQEKKKEEVENKYYRALVNGEIKKIKQHMEEKEYYCTDYMLEDPPYTALYIVLNDQYPVKNRWAVADLLLDKMDPHDLTYLHGKENQNYLHLAEGLLKTENKTADFYHEGKAFHEKLKNIVTQYESNLKNTHLSEERCYFFGQINKNDLPKQPAMEEYESLKKKNNSLFTLIDWANEQKSCIEKIKVSQKKLEKEKAYADSLRKKLNELLCGEEYIEDSINHKNCFGETPLHLAAKNGHHAIVAFLLPYGAKQANRKGDGHSLLTLDNKKFTPAQLAKNKDHDILALWLYLHEAYYSRRDRAKRGYCTLSSSLTGTWEAKNKRIATISLSPNKLSGHSMPKTAAFYRNLYLKRLEMALLIVIGITLPTALLLGLIAGPFLSALTFYVLFHFLHIAAFVPIVVVTALPLLITSILALPALFTLFMAQVAIVLATLESAIEISVRLLYNTCVNGIGPFLSNKVKSPLHALKEYRMIKQLDDALESIRPSLFKMIYKEIDGDSEACSLNSVLFYEPTSKKLFWRDGNGYSHKFFQPFRALSEERDEMLKSSTAFVVN